MREAPASRPFGLGHRALPLALALACLATPAAAHPELDKCRALEGEFDYKGMVPACNRVLSDDAATPEERLEAHRLLAFAHTALGEDDTALQWFVRLLILDPTHTLPDDTSPRFRTLFARAADHLDKAGRVTVVHEPPSAPEALEGGPLTLSFAVRDALERVTSAAILVDAIVDGKLTDPITASLDKMPTESAGVSRFEGVLPDPIAESGSVPTSYTLRYRLVLKGPLGKEVAPDPPVPPITLPRQRTSSSVASSEGGELLLWGGAALASGLVIAGLVGGGVALYCATGRCSSHTAQAPVGFVNVSLEGARGVRP